jgi:selenocysteine lyase/cysteine desulfurase
MKLSRFALSTLRRDFPEIKVYCQDGEDWVGVISFYHKKIHPHDMAAIQDSFNVCIRAGHHCAQPLMRYLNVEATSRISPYFYNTQQDIEVFFKALHKASTIF